MGAVEIEVEHGDIDRSKLSWVGKVDDPGGESSVLPILPDVQIYVERPRARSGDARTLGLASGHQLYYHKTELENETDTGYKQLLLTFNLSLGPDVRSCGTL